MIFSSSIFLFAFLPFVLICYFNPFYNSRKFKNYFLLFSSIIFYAWGEPLYVLLMISSIFFNWLFGVLISKAKNKYFSKICLVMACIYNIGILFVFKYLYFTMSNLALLFDAPFEPINITLPIGISFFTFQGLSYVIDVYRGSANFQKNLLNVGLYISLFPQLIAGPIVRYETIANEIQDRTENMSDIRSGIERFIIGLAKKVIIANNMAVIADVSFSMENELPVIMAWLGAIAYTFQIYFDFSGYSDMAIGLGRIFGFHFLDNFNFPYLSKSITEFWRRWHISLGTWFRDYVYFPLGGSHVSSKTRLIFNLLVVWSLTGLWHGANWTFVLWGILYFILLSAEKLFNFSKHFSFFGHIYTLFFVIIGWVIFRSNNIASAFSYIGAMFSIASSFIDATTLYYLMSYKVYFLIAIICCFPITRLIGEKVTPPPIIHSLAIITLFVITISYIARGGYNPFIYFNF